MYTSRDIYIYIYIDYCMLEKFGSSSSYSHITGLYCGLGLYWVVLSFIYYTVLGYKEKDLYTYLSIIVHFKRVVN